jgi:hypothetical protein
MRPRLAHGPQAALIDFAIRFPGIVNAGAKMHRLAGAKIHQ